MVEHSLPGERPAMAYAVVAGPNAAPPSGLSRGWSGWEREVFDGMV